MDVSPPRATGLLIGTAILLAGLAAVGFGLIQLTQAEISPTLMVWAVLPVLGGAAVALAVYRLFGLANARYVLDRDGIGVRWGAALEEIPLAEARLERPPPTSHASLRPSTRLRWRGCVVGSGEVEGYGRVEFFGTRGPAATLMLISPRRTLAITPPDADSFLRAFIDAGRQGSLRPIAPRSERPDLLTDRVWRDPLARGLLLLGLASPVLLLGFLGLRGAGLPERVAFGFDAQGRPDSLVPAGRLLLLPFIGVLCWAVDAGLGLFFYPRRGDRWLAYALWLTAVVVTSLLWIAALTLLAAS